MTTTQHTPTPCQQPQGTPEGWDTDPGMIEATRIRNKWNTGAAPSKFVFVPGNAKPIDAGSIERAAFIVTACNAHDELVAALRMVVATYYDTHRHPSIMKEGLCQQAVRDALAKVAP